LRHRRSPQLLIIHIHTNNNTYLKTVFWVLGCGCFLVLVDFLLVGLEVLVIVFLDFSVLDLGRLFADIANLLILE